jgi:tetratricopeptide (TPR) repeat protein
MPGDPPRSIHRVSSSATKRRGPETPSAPAQPTTLLAALENDLERARASYEARSTGVGQLLEGIQKRIAEARESAPGQLEAGYALVEATLQTLQGRLWSRTQRDASFRAFQRAVELFEKYRVELVQHSSSTRFRTDWGIALHRIGRNEESIAILSKVCEEGVAPAEAFGYLGYGELTRGRLEAAEAALRKGLEIAPTNFTMSYYFARVLEAAARKIAATEKPEKALASMKAATEAYCRAGEIAQNLGDYSSAGRDGLRALRIEPANERALELAADSYRQLGREKLALLVVERFLTQQPTHPGALGMKGTLLRDLGDVKGSVEVLRSIPASSPNLAWVRAQLALSLSTGDAPCIAEALEAAKEAVVLAPADTFAHRVLGLLQVDRGEYEAAVSELGKAKELGDTSVEVALNLGRALVATGMYERAEEELSAIVAADPRSVGAHFLMGLCAEHLGNSARALAHYLRASRLAPDEPSVFVSLMNLLSKEDLSPQALDEIEGRVHGPLRYLALWYRAKFEVADENWKEACYTLREALNAAEERQAEEDLPGILVDYGDMLRKGGEYENAKAAYGRAYAIDSSRQDVLFGKALYHCEVAEFEDAETCVKRALGSGADDASLAPLWGLHGWCLQHQGDIRNALESYQKALELSEPKDPWYRKGLANALIYFDKDKAKEQFAAILEEQKYRASPEPVTERPSGSASIVGLLGWCNYRLGRYDEAIRLLENAMDRFPDKQTAQFDLALVFLASGRVGLATDAYLRAHELTEKCEKPRQRGLYYIALFDLADAGHQHLLGPDSEIIFQKVKGWLSSSGAAVENLPWLAEGGAKSSPANTSDPT